MLVEVVLDNPAAADDPSFNSVVVDLDDSAALRTSVGGDFPVELVDVAVPRPLCDELAVELVGSAIPCAELDGSHN